MGTTAESRTHTSFRRHHASNGTFTRSVVQPPAEFAKRFDDVERPQPAHADPTANTASTDDSLTILAAMEMFFGDLRLAPRSKKTYRHGVEKFLRHLADNEGINPEVAPVVTIQTEHVTSFASLIVPNDVRTPEEVSRMRTAQNNLSAVRKFCAYLTAYDLHPDLQTDRLRTRISAMMPRFTPPPPDVKLGDLDRIVEYVRGGAREVKPVSELRRLKVRAMILFLYRTGVRVSELCALRRRDVDMETGTASIYRAKGGKSRTVHFDAETAEALAIYWAYRGDPPRGASGYPAFSGRDRLGQPGNPVSPRTVEHIVAELCEATGVESDVTPHSFRHGLATELVRRRVRESTVQTILGHASPTTTRIYVHKTARDVADEYQDAFGTYQPPRRTG